MSERWGDSQRDRDALDKHLTDEPEDRLGMAPEEYKEYMRIQTEDDYKGVCSLCALPVEGYGNNPWPLAEPPRRCCDTCNDTLVIPARLAQVFGE